MDRLGLFRVGVGIFAMGGLVAAGQGLASAAPAAITHSPNFAGYAASAAPTSAAATFTLPTLACTSTDATMVAQLNFTNFTTNNFTGGGVFIGCSNGVAGYSAYTDMNNSSSFQSPSFSAGDRMKITLSESSTATAVSITDLTSKASMKTSESGPGAGSTFTGFSVGIDAVTQSGSTLYPIPAFGKLAFTGVTVNGHTLASSGPLTHFAMYRGAVLLVATGNISPAGTSFSTTFKSS